MGLSVEHPSGRYMEELLLICNPVLMKIEASNPFNYAESLLVQYSINTIKPF